MKQELIEYNGIQNIPQIAIQYVYLDFDGETTTYHNTDLNISLDVKVEDSGMSEEQKRYILAELSEKYASANIVFTVEKPEEIQEYSTIFIGQTNDFEEYGSFAGLAETIDKGNQIKNDDAFVFADSNTDLDTVISVIAHEIGHLVNGAEHPITTGTPADYAVNRYIELPTDDLVNNAKRSAINLGTISSDFIYSGETGGPSDDDYICFTAGVSGTVTVSPYEDNFTVLQSNTEVHFNDTLSGQRATPYANMTIAITAGELYYFVISNYNLWQTSENYSWLFSISGGGVTPTPDPTPDPVTYPDLIVSSFAVTSSSITTTDELQFTFTVRNTGSASADLSQVYLYAGNTLLGSYAVEPIGAGGSVTKTYTVSAGKLTAGTHSLTLRADGKNVVTESNESNNTSAPQTVSVTQTTVQLPDFSVSDLQLVEPVEPGDTSFSVTFNLANTGNKGDGVTYNFLLDGQSFPGNVTWLAAGASSRPTCKLNVYQYSLAAGEHTLTVTAQPSVYDDANTANNSCVLKFTVAYVNAPDLRVSAFAVAKNSISTADSLTLSFTIQNSGTADALASAVYVYDGSVYLGKCSISGLAAGASATQSFTIQPGQLSVGTHSLRVIADGGSLIAESNEDNNQSSVININVSDRDTEAPSKPANVTFSESNGVIFCDWSDSSDNIGVAGYEFRFLRKSGGAKPDYSSAQVRTVTGSNISLSNLAVGSYYYQIRSYDAAGNYSDWTSTAGTFSVTRISENAPSVPSGLKYEILNNQLVLSWNPTVGANNGGGYEIMLGSLKVGSTPKTITVNTNSCVIENPEKYIFWQIRSFNANGEYSDWSAENSYNTWRRSSDAKSILLVFTTNDNIKAEYSYDGFTHVLTTEPDSYYMDVFSLPQGICEVLSYDGGDPDDNTKNLLVSPDPVTGEPEKFQSVANGNMDLFFGNAKVKWESEYAAQHQGMLGWSGTGELVQLNGKNKILDIFSGSADANILVLTDDANGDALFLDDIYSALPESITKQQARLLQINEIRAGAGNDIIDMTSQRFGYYGSEMTICGGDGNDVIWATGSDNDLFGDAGNDRIVGSTGFDLIVGGAGNDSMHSGGGNDIFAFCENWGIDTVEITDNAYITLWFASGNASNWDAGKRVYRDGSNSVTVIGGANSTIDLKFGNAGGQYSDMVDIGAFESAASEKIFEDKNNGMLA